MARAYELKCTFTVQLHYVLAGLVRPGVVRPPAGVDAAVATSPAVHQWILWT